MINSLGEFIRDQGMRQCPLCGHYEEEEQLCSVELDEPDNWVKVCAECKMMLQEDRHD